MIDQQVVENGGPIDLEGVSWAGDSGDFDAGKCTININPVTEQNAGHACNLITNNSTVFSGAVYLGK